MFFDIHAHVYKYQYPDGLGRMLMISPERLKERQDELGISRAVLLPLVSPELYVPQSVGEIIELADRSDGRWLAFCNVDPRVLTNSSDAPIGVLLEHYQKLGCLGIGEVLPNMPWSEPRLQNLLRCAQDCGMPLLFDMTGRLDTGYGIYDDPGMPQLEKSLERFPDLQFIGHGPAFWAEISILRQESDRFGYPAYPVIEEGRIAELMRCYPNLWVEISAGSGANAMLRDTEYAVTFISEFSDRIIFGTDICYDDQPVPQTGFLRELLNKGFITREIFENIAHANAERLLGI
ncbi:MAG: amidohydrolase family protein [Eubacteriales bacterium]|jgi:predicted TIM-barrel fold metal-dependent hydrolase|nr:amidohydrolase family protein [Eubacteriales bacterium]